MSESERGDKSRKLWIPIQTIPRSTNPSANSRRHHDVDFTAEPAAAQQHQVLIRAMSSKKQDCRPVSPAFSLDRLFGLFRRWIDQLSGSDCNLSRSADNLERSADNLDGSADNLESSADNLEGSDCNLNRSDRLIFRKTVKNRPDNRHHSTAQQLPKQSRHPSR